MMTDRRNLQATYAAIASGLGCHVSSGLLSAQQLESALNSSRSSKRSRCEYGPPQSRE